MVSCHGSGAVAHYQTVYAKTGLSVDSLYE